MIRMLYRQFVICTDFCFILLHYIVFVFVSECVLAFPYKTIDRFVFSVYIERLHRPGNKLILVHSIQLPELSISKARMSWQFR